ncbi:hypothetical protein D5081_14425 [Pectobacterium carotovorum]|nr:hypothetical protein D5081_14425 [Pectobacterium carotovorum]RJL39567.1 hypothetical protein D5083_14720 [Pectobacterium carotovorum]
MAGIAALTVCPVFVLLRERPAGASTRQRTNVRFHHSAVFMTESVLFLVGHQESISQPAIIAKKSAGIENR